jgi:HK97 family phage major capsid protein
MLSDGGFMRMPLHTRISIATSAALGSSTSELAPKPISAMSFAQEYLQAYKASALLVVSDELAKSMAPGANDLFANELRKAVALATDTRFLEVISQSTGIVSNPSTGLNNPNQFLADLETAIGAIEVGVGSKLYLVLPADAFKIVLQLRDAGGSLVVNNKIGLMLSQPVQTRPMASCLTQAR